MKLTPLEEAIVKVHLMILKDMANSWLYRRMGKKK